MEIIDIVSRSKPIAALMIILKNLTKFLEEPVSEKEKNDLYSSKKIKPSENLFYSICLTSTFILGAVVFTGPESLFYLSSISIFLFSYIIFFPDLYWYGFRIIKDDKTMVAFPIHDFEDSFSFVDINQDEVIKNSKGYHFLKNIENLNRKPYKIEKEIYEKIFRI